MCGIAGFTGNPSPSVLRRMTDSIIHRGPDDEGFYESEFVSLGMRRLSIVDLATGHQPISNEDRTIWTVFNGEIYNYAGLRKNLEGRGHKFSTDHSDTEVVVHLYEEFGDEWPRIAGVNGMFGLAIWDARKSRLLLYRDRSGKKPLYYSVVDHDIVFASEIKALLYHPAVSKDIDHGALFNYFLMKNTSAPNTAFKAVKQVLPGSYMVWEENKGIDVKFYWKLDFTPTNKDITEEEAIKYLYDLLSDSVAVRMNCDVPYGAYLSGGVDSSAVVALMNANQHASVKTFCLGYEDASEGQFKGKTQDVEYARMMAKMLGTEHHEYIISAGQFAESMPDIVSAFDEPFSGTVSTFFLSTLIKQHVKVALSGDGADELFGSYLSHRLAVPIENWERIKNMGKKGLADLSEEEVDTLKPFVSPERFAFMSSVSETDLPAWRYSLSVFKKDELKELLTDDFLEAAGEAVDGNPYSSLVSIGTASDALNKVLEIDQRELLPNQVLPFVDRLSMAHSVEVRCPYLDYRIVEFVNRLPGGMKIKNGVEKYIHKKALANMLPADLLSRPKEGFVQPIYSWMHSSLKEWIKDRLVCLPGQVFDRSRVSRYMAMLDSGDTSVNAKIWNLVCFGIWWELSAK